MVMRQRLRGAHRTRTRGGGGFEGSRRRATRLGGGQVEWALCSLVETHGDQAGRRRQWRPLCMREAWRVLGRDERWWDAALEQGR